MSESGFSVDDQGRYCYRPPEYPMLLLMSGPEGDGYSFTMWRSGAMLVPMHFKEKPWVGDDQHLGQLARTIARFHDEIGFRPDMNGREVQDLAFRIVSRFATEIVQWEEAHKEEVKVLATPEDRDEASKLLEDPEILCKIYQALTTLGLVGETRNALLLYFTMLSAKLPEPNNQRLSGGAGWGKSMIVVCVSKLFPSEDVLMRSAVTKKWLWYLSEAEEIDSVTRKLNLHGKILILLEESECQEFLKEAKTLLSNDVQSLTYSFVDERVTKQMVLEGSPAYVGVTVFPIQGEEHARRVLLTSPDRGQEKYAAVIREDAKRHSQPWGVTMPKLSCASTECQNKPNESISKSTDSDKEKYTTLDDGKSFGQVSVFVWRRVPPGERCELCGQLAVEYEINDARGHQLLRRCQVCFDKMRRQFSNARWHEEDKA